MAQDKKKDKIYIYIDTNMEPFTTIDDSFIVLFMDSGLDTIVGNEI